MGSRGAERGAKVPYGYRSALRGAGIVRTASRFSPSGHLPAVFGFGGGGGVGRKECISPIVMVC